MIVHDVQQGSQAWHVLRASHFTASEAPAMMGASPYTTRSELLKQKATGIVDAEFDSHKAALFQAGHDAEDSFRPVAENMIGDDLYNVTGTLVVDGLQLLASFDGLTMDHVTGFEHKLWSRKVEQHIVEHGEPPIHHCWQMEQQLLVSGGRRILFVASDGTVVQACQCWYESKPERRAALIAGWKQFSIDLAAYEAEAPKPAPVVAAPQESLPAVSVRVDGQLAIVSNLPAFGAALRTFIDSIPSEPSTDQEFADTEAACKALKRAEDELAAAEDHALAQLVDVGEMRRLVADYKALARTTRLQREKLVTYRKEQIRSEVVASGERALAAHVAALNQRLGGSFMPKVAADFGGVIRGKRTVDSLRDAMHTELARAKIAASEIADRIDANLKLLGEQQKFAGLFPDAHALVQKASDDLRAVISSRIAAHKAEQLATLEAERERIAAEERRKAEAAAEADRARIRAEEQAKAQAEARAEQERQRAAEEAEREMREKAIQAERDAQAGIAEARAADALPAPLLDDLSSLAADIKNDVVSGIDARQAITTAQRTAAAAPAARTSPPTLRIGVINERLQHYTVTAEGLRGLGFEPAGRERAAPLYHEADFPAMCHAIAQHALVLATNSAAQAA